MKAVKTFAAAIVITSILSSFTLAQTRRQSTLSDLDISRGLKAALDKGVRSAIKDLGRQNGFLGNDRVRIPLPDSLKKVEGTMRFLGQGKRVNEFIASMNHAAEKAVPEAVDIFVDSLGQMTFTDARNILFSGQDDAATQFFRRTSEERLRVKFRPIVEEFTEQVGVTQQYKSLIGRYGRFGSFLGQDATDIDGYVTQKALDGLFLLIADEEKRIRRDPIGRTTAILRTVFGVLR
ncbi:MAG: DUF4197 domain-containing protein [Acidobacteria bacterium]|nr:DUF4197 domain-containing protein [Acidobacteriota bacterium]